MLLRRSRRAVAKEPVARGVVVALPERHREPIAMLEKESLSILRAVDAAAERASSVPADADLVLLVIEADGPAEKIPLPDLKDRAASVIAVGEDEPACRGAIARARRHLRAHGAALGARELVLHPKEFGILGLESDGLREKLEILLRTLVNDGERLRLRREGWEEPEE